MRVHADDRRSFWGDIFELEGGDLNVVKLKRHVPIAWHLHQHQTDRLFCVSGRVKVAMIQTLSIPEDSSFVETSAHWFTLREGNTLRIPPNTWHGYEGLTKDATLVQFNSPKYNEKDEFRHPIDAEMPWDEKEMPASLTFAKADTQAVQYAISSGVSGLPVWKYKQR